MQETLVDGLDDLSEDAAPPAPGAVDDNVRRVGDERIVVRVELARLVDLAVVVRVTDRREGAVGHAVNTALHLEHARHFVDHPLSGALFPFEG